MSWTNREIVLRYKIGFVQVGKVRLDALVQTTHFSRLSNKAYERPPRLDLEKRGYDAAFIASCPLPVGVSSIDRVHGTIRYIADRYPHYYLTVEGSFGDYLKRQFRSKTRKSLRRKIKKLAELSGGRLRWHEYRTRSELPEFYRHARALSGKTVQERAMKRGFPAEGADAELRRAEQEDAGRGYLLFGPDDAPIAYLYAVLDDRVMVQEYAGFDPDYGRLSPGSILDLLVLERAFEGDEISVVDFTEGEAEYKRRFASHQQVCGDLFFFPVSAKTAAVVSSHFGLQATYGVARETADKLDLLPRLRRMAKGVARSRGRDGDTFHAATFNSSAGPVFTRLAARARRRVAREMSRNHASRAGRGRRWGAGVGRGGAGGGRPRRRGNLLVGRRGRARLARSRLLL